MCLKKYITYTFSNREAFDRLLDILHDEYAEDFPVGKICIIKKYRNWGKRYIGNRNDSTYVELNECSGMFVPPFEIMDTEFFEKWEELEKIVSKIKDEKDIFGKVKIEVQ